MPYSMTAFSRQMISDEENEITWEIRSVNHRYLEINFRLPEDLRYLETVLREKISQKLKRGKVDLTIKWQKLKKEAEFMLNENQAKQLAATCKQLEHLWYKSLNFDGFKLLQWNGVLETAKEITEIPEPLIINGLEQGLETLETMRLQEGENLSIVIQQKAEQMQLFVNKVRKRRPEVLQKIKEKTLSRLQDITQDFDQERLEQELVYLAQKLDVEEELDRLDSHLQQLQSIINSDQPIGRRLDVLAQELQRETNTLSAKSADLETTQSAMELKLLIEQIREQAQNLE